MPRRKQTYEAYGKVWSPVDIPNLEKAIKCLEKINDLSQNFADSLSGSEAISKQINDNFEAREELQKTGIKLNEEQTKQVLKELKARQQNNDELDDANDKLRKNNNLTWGSVGDRAASALYTKYQKNHPQATDVQLNKAATLFVRAGDVMQIAADTLHNSINTIVSVFTSGLEAQRNMYNSTFQNVSVRTGTTRSTYYANQRALPNTLQSQGLYNNVKVSEVMDMWNKLADIGMNQEQMFTNALDSVITAKIVPYLDVTSRDVNILNTRLDGQFIKQIRGINQASLDLAGNNYMTQELLQTLVDQVQPMSDESLQNLTKGSAEMTALINYLTPKIGSTAATEYATQLYKQRAYGSEIMRSGSAAEKYAYVNVLNSGLNTSNPEDWNNIAALNASSNMFLASLGPDYSTTLSSLYASYFRDAIGMSYEGHSGALNLLNGGETYQSLINHSDMTDAEWEEYYKKVLADLANDRNQTELTMQETLLENMSTDLAIWAQQSGIFYDVVKTALTSIIGLLGSILVNDVGGNIVSAIGGKGTKVAASGIKGGLSKLGGGLVAKGTGTALGGAAVVGGALAGGAMAIKGTSDVIGDFQSGSVDAGTAMSGIGAAGGAVGAGSLIALGASNPIGWIALAVGGAALLGRSLWDSAHNYELAGEAVAKEFNDTAVQLEQEAMQKEESLLQLKESIKEAEDVEEARKTLIESGILTEEEKQEAEKMSKEELENLTQQYINSTKSFSEAEQEMLNNLKTSQIEDANETAQSIKKWFEEDFKKNETDENLEIAKNLMYNTANILNNKGASNWTDEEKKFMERYNKNISEGKLSYDDIKWVLEGGGSWWGISDAIMTNTSSIASDTGFISYANSRGANIKDFNAVDTSMISYATAIKEAKSKEEAEEAVAKAKAAGMVYSQYESEIGDTMRKYGIPAFRVGLNSVPYDNYLANLHEGEAVLTASTANELRGLVSEYRESRNSQINFEAMIQTQTETLVAKLDQVINAINDRRMSMASASSYSSAMYTNMREIKSLKSFE